MSEETYTINCSHCGEDIEVSKNIHDAQTILKGATPEEIHKDCPERP